MARSQGRVRLNPAEHFWYPLQCIWFGAGYFANVPTRKALSESFLLQMTGGEKTWYLLMCC